MRKNIEKDLTNTLSLQIDGAQFQVEGIFIDLDGTLLDKWNKKPSKKNIEAIRKLQEKLPIVISTGRSYNKKVKTIMELLNIEYAICQNGAIIATKDGKILENITLTEEQIKQVIKIVKDHKLGFTINSEFLIYSNHWLWTPLRFLWWKQWKRISKFNYKDKQVNKIVVAGYLKSKKIWEVAQILQKEIKDSSVKTSGKDRIIEITDKRATKGNGAEFISKILNVNIKNTIHIGDSENDSTTLDKVGVLIAMEDGSTKLLDVATHIGPKHKKGGVAKVLNGEFKILKNQNLK